MGILENLKNTGFNFKKSLGQNFIVDESYLESVVNQIGLRPDDIVVEIGTGAGTLTRVLARSVSKVITFEVDKGLEGILSKQFDGFANIQLVFEDALKISGERLSELTGRRGYKLVANIPYYITTPLLLKFIRQSNCVDICVLVQEELAQRIVAKPGGKNYGALSITMQAMAECKIIKKVPRGIFTPVPNVDSAFIKLQVTNDKLQTIEFDKLSELVKGLFSARRKTVLNGLSGLYGWTKEKAGEVLKNIGINETLRPEQIPVEKYLELVRIIDSE